MAEVIFRTASGGDPARYILELARSIAPSVGDLLYAAQRQRARIIERTLRGVDVMGAPFEPYSTNGPYYYYPNGRAGRNKATVKQNRAAARRLLRRIGHLEADISALPEHLQRKIPGINEHGETGARLTRSGQGIKFDSYAAFKAALGRAGVDLTGPRAPHMLQAVQVRVGGTDYGTRDVTGGSTQPATEFALGVYGEAAGRASGHNTGYNPRWKRRHQRYWFGASAADLSEMVSDIYTRIKARLRIK